VKLIVALVAVIATGCAQQRPYTMPQGYNQATMQSRGTHYREPVFPGRGQAVTFEQLQSIKLSNADCARQEQIITWAKQQIAMRGTEGKNPEDLREDDRIYNAAAHTMIWSLRIGCNNPDRYRK